VVRRQFDRYGALSTLKQNVEITTRNGVVTLTGSVPGEQEKDMVQAMVENTMGVVSVDNRLHTTASTPLPFNQTDRVLANRVRQAIKEQPQVAAYAPNLGINADSGVVTLTGTVASERDRDLIEHVAENTPGVQGLIDRIDAPLTPTGRPESRVYADSGEFFNLNVRGLSESDRVLAQRILQDVRTDAALSTSLPVVNMNVSDGKVTLRGNVQSEEQRRAVVSAVRRAAGAENVYDDLKVLPPR
jgi:osmotically-inducible protein OsmY